MSQLPQGFSESIRAPFSIHFVKVMAVNSDGDPFGSATPKDRFWIEVETPKNKWMCFVDRKAIVKLFDNAYEYSSSSSCPLTIQFRDPIVLNTVETKQVRGTLEI